MVSGAEVEDTQALSFFPRHFHVFTRLCVCVCVCVCQLLFVLVKGEGCPQQMNFNKRLIACEILPRDDGFCVRVCF